MELKKKLIEVSKAIEYLKKDKTNKVQGYNYLSEAKIKETIKSKFEEQGIVFNYSTEEVREYEISQTKSGTKQFNTIAKGTYMFIDTDSDAVISGTWFGSGTDTGDKGLYKAITGGIKYVLNTNFLIPTGDDPENDNGHNNDNTTGIPGKPGPVKTKPGIDPDAQLKKDLMAHFKNDKVKAKAEYERILRDRKGEPVDETEAEIEADMETYLKTKLDAEEV